MPPPVPPLACPFPSNSHPLTEALHHESVEVWSKLLGLDPASPSYQRFSKAGFARLMGRCHPRATETDLRLIVDFAVWLFFWDDLCDEVWGRAPEQIEALNDSAFRVMAGAAPGLGARPLLTTLFDVRERLAARMPAPWLARFTRNLQDYFEATVWQADNAVGGEVPDLETYARMRRLTGAVYPALDLVEIAEGVVLPIKVRTHPVLSKLVRTTNNLIVWANDIFSLSKELEAKDHHNLIIVVAQQNRCTLEEGMALAARLHDAEMARFEELERALPEFGPALDEQVGRFVLGLKSWVRANIDWSTKASQRYGLGEPPALPMLPRRITRDDLPLVPRRRSRDDMPRV